VSRGAFDLSLSGYAIRYRDRILAILDPADRFAIPEPLLQNVGSVRTSGVETALAWRPAHGWRIGSALAYTDSRFRNNYLDGTTLVPVRDRVTPDTPRWQAQAGIDYAAKGGFFAGWETLYLAQRFGTPLNNQALPGHAVSTARLGYAHPRAVGRCRELRLQLTADNVFDRSYLGQIDAPGVQESFYYPGAPRRFTAVISLGF
jgi:iron complex outermembrane receptor protein